MFPGLNELPHATARAKWGWFVALGILLLLLSGIAFGNLFVATVVSVYYVGMLMLFGGFVYLVHAFSGAGSMCFPGSSAACFIRWPVSSPS